MLDTSSLSALPDVCSEAGEFDEALRRHRATVTLHASVAQALDGSNADRVLTRFRGLRALGFGRFRESMGLGYYLRREAAGESVGGVVEAKEGDISSLFLHSSDPGKFESLRVHAAGAWRSRARNQAAQMAVTAASLREHWSMLAKAKRRKMRPGLGGIEVSRSVVGDDTDEVRRVLVHGFGGEELAARAKRSPRTHRAHNVFAGLATLNILGTMLGGEFTPAAPFMKLEKDDLNDTVLAAQAAYCDVYLVEDALLRQRLELLVSRGYAFFEVRGVSEWLMAPGLPV
ncbi:MAG: hypothetical protein ACRBN8_24170 [Nannocystales bacterium]